MLAQQRRDLILAELRRLGAVRVLELTEMLGVSDMTVRRDLDVLQSHGVLEKVHGGAVLVGRRTDEPGFDAKRSREQMEKAAIARRAARLAQRGNAVGITAGTTTWYLVEPLSQIPDLTAGFTTPNMAEAETNRTFVRQARRVVVVADHTKWLTVGLHTFAPLTAADVLVTDGEIDPEARATLAADVNDFQGHALPPIGMFQSPPDVCAHYNPASALCAL